MNIPPSTNPPSPPLDHPAPVPPNSTPPDPESTPLLAPGAGAPGPSDQQDRQWSRHAGRYEEFFLDPFRPGVTNPLLDAVDEVSEPAGKIAADLGCGTGPLLPRLVARFGAVIALDFAPGMITAARKRLAAEVARGLAAPSPSHDPARGANPALTPTTPRTTFLTRAMDDLDDQAGRLDLAVAVNSLVMPDPPAIDRTLRAIHRALRPGGQFLGIVPAMDAIHYHTLLLHDAALDRGLPPDEAERHAAFHGEHHYYEFAFGRFLFRGLRQKFWQPFEIEYRFRKAGFRSVTLAKVLYPWDDTITGGPAFRDHPRSWDWFFRAEVDA